MDSPAKILGVADGSVGRRVIAGALDEEYDLTLVSTGERCLQVVPDLYPELIVLDITGPGMTNCEVVRLLRWNSKLKKIGIVMLAESVREMEWARDRYPGPDDYVKKPVDEQLLRRRVGELVQLRATDRAHRLKGDMLALLGDRSRPSLGIIIEVARSLRAADPDDGRSLRNAGAAIRRSAEDLNILIENAYTMVEFETSDRRATGPADR